MPRFAPFRAVHYPAGSDFPALLAPPYDVLSDEDVDHFAAKHERNIVWVDVPRGGDDRYDVAAQTVQQWLDDGTLVRDDEPSFVIYRMSFTDPTGASRTITGVLGGLEVCDEGCEHGVLPHERTTPKAKTDRLDLTRATGMNMSPVWGLSLANGLTDELREPAELLGELNVDGVHHVFELVTDPARQRRIADIIGSDDVLVADGHHRYAISRTYRDQVRKAHGDATEAELTLTFVNELKEDQLAVRAIHRIYEDADIDALRAALSQRFDFEPAPEPSAEVLADMARLGRLVLIGPDAVEWLIPKPGAFEGVRSLDGAWLEATLEGTGIEPSYQHDVDEIVDSVRAGHASAGILIRPTSVHEIMRTAREGLLMPPKSTFFTPKPLTGVVIRQTHQIDE